MANGPGWGGSLTVGSAVTRVKDVTLQLEAAERDATTRASEGWEDRRAGLKRWGASFDMVVDSADSVFSSMQTAFKNGTSLSVTVADGLGHSVAGNCSITNFTRNEPLGETITASVTLVGNGKPTVV